MTELTHDNRVIRRSDGVVETLSPLALKYESSRPETPKPVRILHGNSNELKGRYKDVNDELKAWKAARS